MMAMMMVSPPSSQTSVSGSPRCVAYAGLISRDGPRRFPVTFPGGPACYGRSNQLVGGNVMSLLTGGEQAKCCSWVWSQSRPHQVKLFTQGKTAVIVDQSWAPRTAKLARGVAHTSLRCMGHLARALDWVFFFFPFSKAATQLARQVQQERTHVVCSNKVGRSRMSLPQWTLDLLISRTHSHNFLK